MHSFLAIFSLFVFILFSNASPEDESFAKCCLGIGLKDGTVKTACKYPPEISFLQRIEIGNHITGYIGCFAAHKDNTVCCAEGGVKGACLDICNGANPPASASFKYLACSNGKTGLVINECNQKAAVGIPAIRADAISQ